MNKNNELKTYNIPDSIKNLHISLRTENVYITSNNGSESKIEYSEDNEINKDDDTLFIEQKKNNNSVNNISIGKMNFNGNSITICSGNTTIIVNGKVISGDKNVLQSNSSKLKISLSKEKKYGIMIRSYSGDVVVNDINGIGIGIKTIDGEVSMFNTNSESIDIDVTSGDIKLSNVNVSSDENSINECIDGMASIKTTNGDVEIEDLASGSLNVETTSGDVSINNINAKTIRIKTTQGDICCRIKDYIENYLVKVVSLRGDTDIMPDIVSKSTNEPSRTLDASSVQGDIGISFTKTKR